MDCEYTNDLLALSPPKVITTDQYEALMMAARQIRRIAMVESGSTRRRAAKAVFALERSGVILDDGAFADLRKNDATEVKVGADQYQALWWAEKTAKDTSVGVE